MLYESAKTIAIAALVLGFLALGRVEEAERRIDALVGGAEGAIVRGAAAGGSVATDPALLAAAGGALVLAGAWLAGRWGGAP